MGLQDPAVPGRLNLNKKEIFRKRRNIFFFSEGVTLSDALTFQSPEGSNARNLENVDGTISYYRFQPTRSLKKSE